MRSNTRNFQGNIVVCVAIFTFSAEFSRKILTNEQAFFTVTIIWSQCIQRWPMFTGATTYCGNSYHNCGKSNLNFDHQLSFRRPDLYDVSTEKELGIKSSASSILNGTRSFFQLVLSIYWSSKCFAQKSTWIMQQIKLSCKIFVTNVT